MAGGREIKPIETVYSGYRFRSRLEARWAVAFDYLGIEWEYEKEGYDVDGTWYLPDFFCPVSQNLKTAWIEIKPTPLDKQQIELYGKFANMRREDFYAICGNPWHGEYMISFFQGDWFEDRPTPQWDGMRLDRRKRWLPDRSGFQKYSESMVISSENNSGFPDWSDEASADFDSITKAFHAARSARFEHGESPNARNHSRKKS